MRLINTWKDSCVSSSRVDVGSIQLLILLRLVPPTTDSQRQSHSLSGRQHNGSWDPGSELACLISAYIPLEKASHGAQGQQVGKFILQRSWKFTPNLLVWGWAPPKILTPPLGACLSASATKFELIKHHMLMHVLSLGFSVKSTIHIAYDTVWVRSLSGG